MSSTILLANYIFSFPSSGRTAQTMTTRMRARIEVADGLSAAAGVHVQLQLPRARLPGPPPAVAAHVLQFFEVVVATGVPRIKN